MFRQLHRLFIPIALVLSTVTAWAVDPFDNWANPEGLYFVDYPLHYNAQQLTDINGKPQITNADFHVTENLFRFVYYKSAPKTSLWNIIIPVGRTDFLDKHNTGIGDLLLSVGYFFIDDKAKNTYLGVGLKVDAPTGSYDKNRLAANMGSNVWRFRPLLAAAKLAGPFDLEATATYDIKTENKDALIVGPFGPVDARVKEGNRMNIETYEGMFLSHQWLVGFHLNQTWGQNWKINGAETDGTKVKFGQFGGSVQWMPTPKCSVMLQAIEDFAVHNSFKGTLVLSRIAYKFI